MGLRFRHSFSVFPGVKLNLSGSGVSASLGVPGATLNIGRRGVRATVGIPGSGLSYSTSLGDSRSPRSSPNDIAEHWRPEPALPLPASRGTFGKNAADRARNTPTNRQIASRPIEMIGSPGLAELAQMLVAARSQAQEIEADLRDATALRDRLVAELTRKQKSIFRRWHKKRIKAINREGLETEQEIERLEGWRNETACQVDFGAGDSGMRAWTVLESAFSALMNCSKIWDITSDRDVDRAAERTTANRTIERKPVLLQFADHDVVSFEGRALRFANANGGDLLLYPTLGLVPRSDGAFALLDAREIKLAFEMVKFQEDDSVPGDSEVVGHTWLRANRDGGPDRRFADNRQIPVCLYGRLVFSTSGGLWEEDQFSNARAAAAFADAFNQLQRSIS